MGELRSSVAVPGRPTLLALRIVGLVWAQAPLVVGAFGWGVVAGHLTGEEPDVALTSDLVRHAGLIACAVLTTMLLAGRPGRGFLSLIASSVASALGLVATALGTGLHIAAGTFSPPRPCLAEGCLPDGVLVVIVLLPWLGTGVAMVLTALRSARGWRGLLLRVVPALVWIGLVALQQAVQPRVPIGV